MLAFAAAVTACDGSAPPVAPEEGPAVAVRRLAARDLPCTDPCGFLLTFEARRVDTGEPVAATLRLTGDGWFPRTVTTTLPAGQVEFYWEYPRPKLSGTSYRLNVCPAVGACESMKATIYLPEP